MVTAVEEKVKRVEGMLGEMETLMIRLETVGDRVEFHAGDGLAAQPYFRRNEAFQIEWPPAESAVRRIVLREFRALSGGPPWIESPPEWGVAPEVDGSLADKIELVPESVCWVRLPTAFPFPVSRLIQFTVTVEREDGSTLSFVDPWDEVPCSP